MISSLNGVVSHISGNVLTLDVQGVGYEVLCTMKAASTLVQGETRRVVVFTDVQQDSIRLYGFEDRLEKQVFLLLTRVKGLGAKSASEVLSKVDKKDLLRIIASGDSARLQSIKGIGKKTSERIILELKDKVAEFVLGAAEPMMPAQTAGDLPTDEAVQALQALGFTKKDAEAAVRKAAEDIELGSLSSGEIVREALRFV